MDGDPVQIAHTGENRAARKDPFLCEQELALGVTVEVSLGYTAIKPVFWGYLYEISYELGETRSLFSRAIGRQSAGEA